MDRQKKMSETSDGAMSLVMLKQLKGVALSWFNENVDFDTAKNWPQLQQALMAKFDTKLVRSRIRQSVKRIFKQPQV